MDDYKEFLNECTKNKEMTEDEWETRWFALSKAGDPVMKRMGISGDTPEARRFIIDFGMEHGFSDVIQEMNRRLALLGVGSLEELEL